MCTYITEKVALAGSGKGAQGWFRLSEASVYLDHPVHALADHTLNIDFRNPTGGPAARVAVEMIHSTSAFDTGSDLKTRIEWRELMASETRMDG